MIGLTSYLISQKFAEFAQSTIAQVEDKSNFHAVYCQARTDVLLCNFDRAIKGFETLIELDATFIEAYVELGHCLYKLCSTDEALRAYLRAIRVSNLT